MLRIGSVELPTNLLLAPVAGYFDMANRAVVKAVKGVSCEAADLGGPLDAGDGTYGAVGLTCTELLCPQSVLKESDKALWLSSISPGEHPAAMQLYGSDPAILADAARWAQAHGAAVIDINMGCPVDKVTKKNGGSQLLCDPFGACGAVAVCKAVAAAVTVPVTCKIRLGWDDEHLIVDTLPPALCDVGAQAVTVHGRTTQMRFNPSVRLEGIARAVAAVKKHHPKVPVIGNGDIVSPAFAKKMFDETGCAGVMVARAAMGRPWIFRDIAFFLKKGVLPPPLPRAERAKLVLMHFDLLLAHRGERTAINMIRFRTAKYSPHLQPWPLLRRAVQPMKEAQEFRAYWQEHILRLEKEDAAGVVPPGYEALDGE